MRPSPPSTAQRLVAYTRREYERIAQKGDLYGCQDVTSGCELPLVFAPDATRFRLLPRAQTLS